MSKFTFQCSKCRSKAFDMPANPKPNDAVTCNGCGATSKYAVIQAAAIKQAKQAAEKTIRDSIKRAGFK